jgi:hypothetical protein
MRVVTARLRSLMTDAANGIGIEGAALIAAIALLAYGAGLYDERLPWIVVGFGLLIVFYATARPQRPAGR